MCENKICEDEIERNPGTEDAYMMYSIVELKKFTMQNDANVGSEQIRMDFNLLTKDTIVDYSNEVDILVTYIDGNYYCTMKSSSAVYGDADYDEKNFIASAYCNRIKN